MPWCVPAECYDRTFGITKGYARGIMSVISNQPPHQKCSISTGPPIHGIPSQTHQLKSPWLPGWNLSTPWWLKGVLLCEFLQLCFHFSRKGPKFGSSLVSTTSPAATTCIYRSAGPITSSSIEIIANKFCCSTGSFCSVLHICKINFVTV